MADVVNIPSLVWKILNITPQLLGQYRTIQDQLLYLIFIPNLVLIFFIYWFATTITMGHKGFRNLFGIASYATLILSGWYGRLIPVFVTYWWLLIGVALFLFIMNFFLPIGKSRERELMGENIFGGVTKRFLERRDAGKRLHDIDRALKDIGISPDIDLSSQSNFNKLGKEAQQEVVKLVTMRQQLKRQSKEWV